MVMPVAAITSAHFRESSCIAERISAGELAMICMPCGASAATNLGPAAAVFTACDNRSITASDVLAGASIPNHERTSYPATPASSKVGIYGIRSDRWRDAIARIRSLPASISGFTEDCPMRIMSILPPIKSAHGGGRRPIGDMDDIGLGRELEELHPDMQHGPDPGRRIVELAGIGFRQGDQFLHVIGLDGGIDDEHQRRVLTMLTGAKSRKGSYGRLR